MEDGGKRNTPIHSFQSPPHAPREDRRGNQLGRSRGRPERRIECSGNGMVAAGPGKWAGREESWCETHQKLSMGAGSGGGVPCRRRKRLSTGLGPRVGEGANSAGATSQTIGEEAPGQKSQLLFWPPPLARAERARRVPHGTTRTTARRGQRRQSGCPVYGCCAFCLDCLSRLPMVFRTPVYPLTHWSKTV